MNPYSFTKLRLAMGMDQGQIATALGISRDQVNRYENGRSNIPSPVAIALDHLANCPGTKREVETTLETVLQKPDDSNR